MRMKQYTKEELVAGQDQIVQLSVSSWREVIDVRKIVVKKITDKTVMMANGSYSRVSFDEFGTVKMNSIFCLADDVEDVVVDYKRQMVANYEEQIAKLQQKLETTKNLKYRGEK